MLNMQVILLLTVLAAVCQTGSVSASQGFRVSGTNILDGSGKLFVMRGINYAHTWFKNDLHTAIPKIAATGVNTVRVVLSNGEKYQRDDTASVMEIIDLCYRYKMVVIFEVHDATGNDDPRALDKAVDYWISIAGALKGREDQVMINIANEWTKSSSADQWAHGYTTAIPKLRKAGLKNLIVVDAAGYGQFVNAIPLRGKEIFNADPLKNTIFSVHMYEVGAPNAATVQHNIDACLAIGVPVIVGEFSDQQNGKKADYQAVIKYCQQRNVGWIAWSWHGNTDPRFDLAKSAAGPLTDLGQKIVFGPYGIQQTVRH